MRFQSPSPERRASSERHPSRIWLSLAALTFLGLGLVGACASEGSETDTPPTIDPGDNLPGTQTGKCDNEGALRDCSVDLGTTASGVHSCMLGVQSCVDGQWSACGHGDGAQQLALSAPGACPANPCDPNCEQYDENPVTPPISGGGIPSNAFGYVSDLPGGFQDKGLCPDNNMPCLCDPAVQDCQFDYYCSSIDDTCQPWNDGDYGVGGLPDLTVRVPCSTGTIQVCNRGNVQAPAGIPVTIYPGNSGKMANCAANSQKPPAAKGQCLTTATIDPGECLPVTGCESALTSGGNVSNIVVNHVDSGIAPIAESNCKNNWSTYDKTSSGSCACANLATTITSTPLTMYIMLDNSGSMNNTNWTTARDGLTAFFTDNTTSPGLGVAFRLWPDGAGATTTGCTAASSVCDPVACADPDIEKDVLTAAVGEAHELALVANMPASATGTISTGTPMYPALEGAIDWAVAYEGANPTEKAVVVFVTDGDPFGCNTNMTQIRALASAGLANGIETYTVGLNGSNTTDLTNIASDGGGLFFDLTSGNSAAFTAAMAAIQLDAAPCDWTVTGVSASGTTVNYVDSGGTANPVTQVANAAACTVGLQYYYDNPLLPTQLNICPATCSTINADVGARLEIVSACQPYYTSVTYQDDYEASCTAPDGPEWTFLAYDTTTPATATVDFEVRTSATQAGLASEAWIPVATATNASPDAGLDTSVVPQDLQAVLTPSQYRASWLEMRATMNPTSDNTQPSQLEQWQVWYTCQPQE